MTTTEIAMPHTNAYPTARAVRITAAAGIAALAMSAVWAAPAWAHDSLIGSSPAAGEVLESSPEEIVLEFSGAGLTTGEGITNDIWVLDEEGENWASDDPAVVEGATMSTELADELPNGEYEVRYRAVYSDGHDEELSFEFEVDAQEEPATEEEAPEQAAPATDEAEATETDATEPAESPAESPQGDAAQNPAAEEGGFPIWTAAAIGAGVLLLVILALVLVRRQLRAGGHHGSSGDA